MDGNTASKTAEQIETPASGEHEEQRTSTSRLLLLAMSTRLVADTGLQLFNPFLPIFAEGLGVSIVTVGRLVSLRTAVGIVAPLFGTFADRLGYRFILRVELLLAVAGFILVGISNNIWMAAAGMVVLGAGLTSFTPTLHAFLSERLPWNRRGRGLAIVEYSWALAGIAGLFLTGFVIEFAGWRAPFFILAAGLAIAWVVFGRLRGAGRPADRTPRVRQAWGQVIRNFFDLGANARSAWSNMLLSGFIGFAGINVFIVHGAWLNRHYGLRTTQLGTVALLLGVADLAGSGLASLIVDRLGKRRSVLLGASSALLTFLVLPQFDISAALVIGGLALSRFAFEFSIVSNITLLSEQVPEQRGKVLSQGAMVMLAGFSLGSLAGPWLFERFGVVPWSWASAASMGVVLLLLIVTVREPQGD